MADETNDESGDQPDYRVLQATMEEIAAAGEAILEVLRRSDPQSEDEVLANTHLERGLVELAGRSLERGELVTIEGQGPKRMYRLKK